MEEKIDAYQYSPLSLAYIGDSVFDLIIKTRIVKSKNMPANKYHIVVSKLVNAKSQAAFIDKYLDTLRQDEIDIFKRGRNANSHSKAKNATRSEYQKATGFEAIVGYLYLKGDIERLEELGDLYVMD